MSEVGDVKFESIKSIGVFRALHLGDLLCIIPAVRAIRHACPNARITLVGLSSQRDFTRRFNLYFDDFMEFPGWPGLPEQEPDTERILPFLQEVRQRNFDLLLQMHGNGMVTNSMCLLWGAKHVAGLRTAGKYCPDENLFPISENDEPEPLRFLKLVDALGITRQGENLEFPILAEEVDNFIDLKARLDLNSGRFVCIHPGARDPRKRWPIENFAFIAKHLAKNGYEIVLTGSMAERSILKSLEEKIGVPVLNITTAANHIGIGELAVFFRTGLYLISNDNGVSQIASALRIPNTIIFSRSSEISRWAPLDRSIHKVIPFDKGEDPEYVLYCILDQLEKQPKKQLPVLLH